MSLFYRISIAFHRSPPTDYRYSFAQPVRLFEKNCAIIKHPGHRKAGRIRTTRTEIVKYYFWSRKKFSSQSDFRRHIGRKSVFNIFKFQTPTGAFGTRFGHRPGEYFPTCPKCPWKLDINSRLQSHPRLSAHGHQILDLKLKFWCATSFRERQLRLYGHVARSLHQGESCLKDMDMTGLASVWAMARRRPVWIVDLRGVERPRDSPLCMTGWSWHLTRIVTLRVGIIFGPEISLELSTTIQP